MAGRAAAGREPRPQVVASSLQSPDSAFPPLHGDEQKKARPRRGGLLIQVE